MNQQTMCTYQVKRDEKEQCCDFWVIIFFIGSEITADLRGEKRVIGLNRI